MTQAGAAVALVGPIAMLLLGYGIEGAGVALASGLSAALLSRIEDIKLLVAPGFRAELERAQRIAEQASVTAEELRRLAIPLARMALGSAAASGRMGTSKTLKRINMAQVEQLLASISATPAERDEALTDLRAWNHLDAGFAVLRALPHDDKREGKFFERFMDNVALAVAESRHWREAARDLDALTPEVEAALAALDAAAAADKRPDKHGDLPRPAPPA